MKERTDTGRKCHFSGQKGDILNLPRQPVARIPLALFTERNCQKYYLLTTWEQRNTLISAWDMFLTCIRSITRSEQHFVRRTENSLSCANSLCALLHISSGIAWSRISPPPRDASTSWSSVCLLISSSCLSSMSGVRRRRTVIIQRIMALWSCVTWQEGWHYIKLRYVTSRYVTLHQGPQTRKQCWGNILSHNVSCECKRAGNVSLPCKPWNISM